MFTAIQYHIWIQSLVQFQTITLIPLGIFKILKFIRSSSHIKELVVNFLTFWQIPQYKMSSFPINIFLAILTTYYYLCLVPFLFPSCFFLLSISSAVYGQFFLNCFSLYLVYGGGRPEIVEEVQNITVALGRDAILKCYVKHLADYKVVIYTYLRFSHIKSYLKGTVHRFDMLHVTEPSPAEECSFLPIATLLLMLNHFGPIRDAMKSTVVAIWM